MKPVLRLAPARLKFGAGFLETGHARRTRDGVNLADHRVGALALPHIDRRLGGLPLVHGIADRPVLLAPDAGIGRAVADPREGALLRCPGEVTHVGEAPPGKDANENKPEVFHVANRLLEHLVCPEIYFAPGALYAGESRIGKIRQKQQLVPVLKAWNMPEHAFNTPRERVVAPENRVKRRLGCEYLGLPDALLRAAPRRNLRERVGRDAVEARAEEGGDGLLVVRERIVLANDLFQRRNG